MSAPPATSACSRSSAEGAVAAGVRRIEALTGEAARRHLAEQERRLKAVAAALKVSPAEVPARVEALVDERRKLERELAEARKKLALGGGRRRGAGDEAETVAGVGFLGTHRRRRPPKDLKALADEGKKARLRRRRLRRHRRRRQGELVVGRHRRSDQALQRRRSGARRLAALGGQGGGGRPDMAQAGGPDATKAPRRSPR